MPIDWSKIIQTAAVAAPGIIGAVAGSKAQSGAAKENREAAEKAYQRAIGSVRAGSEKAGGLYDWMFQQSLPLINQGYSQARGDVYNAFNNAQDILSPYTGAGRRGAQETNFLLYGAGPGPESFAPRVTPGGPMPTGSPVPTGGAPNIPLPQGFGGNPVSQPNGGYNAFAGYAPTTTVKGSTAPGVGDIVGMATGGMAAPLVGRLVGHLTRKGREKEAASNEVNHFSDWFWNDVKPLYDQGKLDKDSLQQVAQQGFDTYRNWLGDTLKDKNVASNSATSQLNYFNQGLNPMGITVR